MRAISEKVTHANRVTFAGNTLFYFYLCESQLRGGLLLREKETDVYTCAGGLLHAISEKVAHANRVTFAENILFYFHLCKGQLR